MDVRGFPALTPDDEELRELTSSIEDFNGRTWKAKKDAGLSLNVPISGVLVPENLNEFTSILTQMHKLE